MTEWTIVAGQWFGLSLGLYLVTAWTIKPAVRLVGDARRRAGKAGPMRGRRLERYELVLRSSLLMLGVAVALVAPWEVAVAPLWRGCLGVAAMGLSTQIHAFAKWALPAAMAARLGLSTPLREPEAEEPAGSSLADIETLGG